MTIDAQRAVAHRPDQASSTLQVGYDPGRECAERLHYRIDTAALGKLANKLYGQRCRITGRNEWSGEQILLACRGQSEVEEAFRRPHIRLTLAG